MTVGFACQWDANPVTTWSNTPWNLRRALRALTDVQDVGIDVPAPVRLGLKAACAQRVDGAWVSMWKHSRPARAYVERSLLRSERGARADAILEVGDLAAFDRPFFILQDMSFDVLLKEFDVDGGGVRHFPGLSLDAVLRLRDRQHRIYERATGVLAMSGWLADSLIRDTGLPPSKVSVVRPGATASATAAATAAQSQAGGAPGARAGNAGERRRLLFVGKDFHVKGGEQVVAALAVLRRDYRPDVTLTVAGPQVWPMAGDPPPGVDFLGRVPVSAITALYESHDLFVMPSRFEGFGIVFAEALSHGLPCIGRDAWAMPEIITDGLNGALISSDSPQDLAGVIWRVLTDDQVFANCADAVSEVIAYYSWDRAAREVLDVLPAISRRRHPRPVG